MNLYLNNELQQTLTDNTEAMNNLYFNGELVWSLESDELTEGLIHHYPLNNTVESLDIVGSLHGTPTDITYDVQGAHFAEVGSQIEILEPTFEMRNMSLSLWFKADDTGIAQTIFSKTESSSVDRPLLVGLYDFTLYVAQEYNNINNVNSLDGNTDSTTWFNVGIAIGADGSSTPYLNGVADDNFTPTEPYRDITEPVLLGAILSQPSNANLAGNIGSVRIYDNKIDSGMFNRIFQEEQAIFYVPIVTMLGDSSVNVYKDDVYVDAGATALDYQGNDVTAYIVTDEQVDTSIVGTYSVTYTPMDGAMREGEPAIRTISVTNWLYLQEQENGYCTFPPGGSCIENSLIVVDILKEYESISYSWSVSGATIDGSTIEDYISVSTPVGSESVEYIVTLDIIVDGVSYQLVETFTQIKEITPIQVTDIDCSIEGSCNVGESALNVDSISLDNYCLITADTALVTMDFNVAPSGLSIGDIDANNGTLSSLTEVTPTQYTALYTPTDALFVRDNYITIGAVRSLSYTLMTDFVPTPLPAVLIDVTDGVNTPANGGVSPNTPLQGDGSNESALLRSISNNADITNWYFPAGKVFMLSDVEINGHTVAISGGGTIRSFTTNTDPNTYATAAFWLTGYADNFVVDGLNWELDPDFITAPDNGMITFNTPTGIVTGLEIRNCTWNGSGATIVDNKVPNHVKIYGNSGGHYENIRIYNNTFTENRGNFAVEVWNSDKIEDSAHAKDMRIFNNAFVGGTHDNNSISIDTARAGGVVCHNTFDDQMVWLEIANCKGFFAYRNTVTNSRQGQIIYDSGSMDSIMYGRCTFYDNYMGGKGKILQYCGGESTFYRNYIEGVVLIENRDGTDPLAKYGGGEWYNNIIINNYENTFSPNQDTVFSFLDMHSANIHNNSLYQTWDDAWSGMIGFDQSNTLVESTLYIQYNDFFMANTGRFCVETGTAATVSDNNCTAPYAGTPPTTHPDWRVV